MHKTSLFSVIIFLLLGSKIVAADPEALGLVEKAFDYWRGMSSYSEFSMTIHRPDFERTMILKGWTRGRGDALFFVQQPPKDAGNGTLKKGKEMWSYNPKINRAVKLPPSMMSQSWMGSDFSNDDLAKSDSILEDYDHIIVDKSVDDGHEIFTVESVAKEDAPVVWGKQILKIRDDFILLNERFYDEDMVLVKEMTAKAHAAGALFDQRGNVDVLVANVHEAGTPVAADSGTWAIRGHSCFVIFPCGWGSVQVSGVRGQGSGGGAVLSLVGRVL